MKSDSDPFDKGDQPGKPEGESSSITDLSKFIKEKNETAIADWLKAWLAENQEYLINYASRALFKSGLQAKAEDVVMNTMVTVWRRLDQFKANGTFRGWVTTILRNNCINQVRKEIRERRTLELFASTIEGIQSDDDDSYVDEQSVNALKAAANKLDEIKAMIVQMYYYQGLNNREISERLNLSEDQVNSHRRRALLALRESVTKASAKK